MKKKLINVLTPHNRIFPSEYVICVIKTMSELSYEYDVDITLTESPLVHANRNALLYYAYKTNADYALFVDSDMIWSPDDIRKLIKDDKDVVTALVRARTNIKDLKNPAVVFEYDKNHNHAIMKQFPDELFKCNGVGTAFLLIKRPVIKKLIKEIGQVGYPFDYRTRTHYDNNDTVGTTSFLGEDLSFSYRVEELGFEMWCDPKVQVGHIVSRVIGLDPYSTIRATHTKSVGV